MSSSNPHIEIHEQPKTNVLRFRYATEGEKAGSIAGEHSTVQHQTFPSVRLINCSGLEALVIASCVTASDPLRPHPHRLVGQDCKQGACRVSIKNAINDIVPLTKIGIQCCKQKDIDTSLEERDVLARKEYIGGAGVQNTSFDLTTVRLCFQLFVYCGDQLTYCDMKVSNPIIDKKALNELMICRISRSSGTVRGGDEVFMLCTAIKKDDIEVVFASPDNSWEAKGEFTAGDIHKQFAIVFKTPPYRHHQIDAPVEVNMFLRCPSKNQVSEAKTFQYFPEDPDPYHIDLKRKRNWDSFTKFVFDHNIPSSSSDSETGQVPNSSTLSNPMFLPIQQGTHGSLQPEAIPPTVFLPIQQGTHGSLQPVAIPPTVFLPIQHPMPLSTQPSPRLLPSPHHGSAIQAPPLVPRARRRAAPKKTLAAGTASAMPKYSNQNLSFSVAHVPTEHKVSFVQQPYLPDGTNLVTQPESVVMDFDESNNMAASDGKLPDDLKSLDENDLLHNFLEAINATIDVQPFAQSNRSDTCEDIKPNLVTDDSAAIPLTVVDQSLNDVPHHVPSSVADQSYVDTSLQSFDAALHSVSLSGLSEDWRNYLHELNRQLLE